MTKNNMLDAGFESMYVEPKEMFTGTVCCAFSMGRNFDDSTPISLIQKMIDKKRREFEEYHISDNNRGDNPGHSCISIVAVSHEKNLEANLRKLGFKHVHSFPRRNGYNYKKLYFNKLYVLNLVEAEYSETEIKMK